VSKEITVVDCLDISEKSKYDK